MRILFLDQSGALGGAELYLLDVARAYRATSRVVLFEDGPFRERLAAEGIPVAVLPVSGALHRVRKHAGLIDAVRAVPGLLRAVLRIARMARGVDLIFANTQKALLVGGLAGRLARRPVIWNLHDLLTADHFTSWNRRVAVACANRLTTHVIANSHASLRAFQDAGGRTNGTSIVYNGIDPAPFDAVTPHQVRALRHELGLGRAPVVGVFSRLTPWKGQDVLLDAVADLPGVHAMLVGDALFAGDRPYREALQAQADRLGIADRVHWLGFRDDVPALMGVCDVVAHTSTAPEPFGRVIVEGMLAERPVVATRAGGAVEIVTDGQTGRLVPPGDAPALAHVLAELLYTPEADPHLAARGHQHARDLFSHTAMLTGIAHALNAALDGDPVFMN